MQRRKISLLACGMGLLCTWAAPVLAANGIATVVALQGVLEVQRGKAWAALGTADEVERGARLRTAAGTRAKLLFEDDTVVDLGAASELSIESFDSQPGKRQALLRLSKGKLHAWVGEQYKASKARFEIETPTAISGVRGTEMIVVYSPETELTEVIGLTDTVQVFGKLGVLSGSVEVGANGYTQVQKGRFPTQVQQLDALRLRQFLEGLELRGTGRRDGLNVEHSLVMGRPLAKEDVPATAVATQEPPSEESDRPQRPLAFTYSTDVYTNRQPLRQYQLNPPGGAAPGSGGVIVDF